MSNQMSDEKFKVKLCKIIDEGKAKSVTKSVRKRKLMKLKKKKKKVEFFLF